MAITVDPPKVRSKESAREILKADFKSIAELPIRGGWGYTQDDAVIIDRDDPVAPQGQPFDGVGYEHVFVEKRIYEELIVFRPEHARFSGIRFHVARQELVESANRRFDRLEVVVFALPDLEWNRLKAEWEGPSGHVAPDFDHRAHEADRESKTITYTATYWFDITSFFGVDNGSA